MLQLSPARRLRQWTAALVAALMVASLLVVAAAVTPRPAGALDLRDCQDAHIFPTLSIPESHNDGGPNDSGPDFVTTWNKPLDITGDGVLANDGYTYSYTNGTRFEPKPERLRSIMWAAPTAGSVTLDTDGTFVYTPKFRYGEYPLDKTLVVTFQYLAFDTASQLCSDPTTVTVTISGFSDVAGEPPTASPDAFPNADTTPNSSARLFNNGVLTVPAPGVLANDFNNFSYALNDGIDATLVSPPVWKGTTTSAGTITNWGRRDDLTPTPGGFTFTPALSGYGTAVFTYQACYNSLAITANACSKPAEVSIDVRRSSVEDEARPIQKDLNAGVWMRLTYDELRDHVTFDPTDPYLEPEFGALPEGEWFNQQTETVDGEVRFKSVAYSNRAGVPAEGIPIPYRMCGNVPAPDSPRRCTSWGTITVRGPQPLPPQPKVVSVALPKTADDNVMVYLDGLVKGATSSNVSLTDLGPDGGNGSHVPLSAQIRCQSPYDAIFSRCDQQADRIILDPDQPLVSGHAYYLQLPSPPGSGIVAFGDSGLPLAFFTTSWVFTEADRVAPTATPTATAPPGTWTKHDVTVSWTWSDSGSGVDPAKCTTSSTSSGEGVQTLTATCADLAGNVGTASYAVKVDTTPPKVSLVMSPPMPKSGWYTTDVTMTWNWSDAGSGFDPATCAPSTTDDREGQLLLVLEGCTDRAGNLGFGGTSYGIDRSAPVASPVLSNPGWSNEDVIVTWNWSDAISGIDPANCPATSIVSAEGLSGVGESCADLAGHVGSAGRLVLVDKTAPAAAPTLSDTGWSKTDVTVTWNWSDAGSGVDTTKCPASSTSSGEGTLTVTSSCTDVAGNTKTASAVVMVDRSGPTLAPKVTPNPVLIGGTATVTANATDGGSGVASSSCGQADTTTGGAKTVQCSAIDAAGNGRTATAGYVVNVGVTWLLKPTSIRAKAGSAVTAAVVLTGANGRPLTSAQARTLPACSVTFRLGAQAPVCGTFIAVGTFGATVKSTTALTVGTTLPLVTTVTIGGTSVGSATSNVAVMK